jgi:acetyl esterase/lipase
MKSALTIFKFSYLTLLISIFCYTSCQRNKNKSLSLIAEETKTNVSYGSHPRQKYDIYLPAGRSSTTPVIFVIHGGAWKAGQKEDMNYIISEFKAKWKDAAYVNLNYRLASNSENIHHPQIIADIQSVLNHVKIKKDEYKISENFGILGASAGGQLAMIYAYKYNNPAVKSVCNIFGPSIINDFSWYDSYNVLLGTKVGTLLTEYVGQPWDSAAYANVSPYWQVKTHSPPTILFHGNLDPIVPYYQSQYMHYKLNELGIPNQFHTYVAFHSFDAQQTTDMIQKTIVFFKSYLK